MQALFKWKTSTTVCTVSARGGAAGHSKPNISGQLSGRNLLFNIFQPQLVRSAAPTLHATTSPNNCESTQVQSWALKLKRPLFCIHKVNLRILVPQTLSLFRSRRAEQWYGDGKERQNLKCPCKAHLQVCYFSYGFLLEQLLIPRHHLFSHAI